MPFGKSKGYKIKSKKSDSVKGTSSKSVQKYDGRGGPSVEKNVTKNKKTGTTSKSKMVSTVKGTKSKTKTVSKTPSGKRKVVKTSLKTKGSGFSPSQKRTKKSSTRVGGKLVSKSKTKR